MQFYAKDIMSEMIITARPDMATEEAAELFMINRITGAPVVDANGVLIGVITIHDLLSAERSPLYTTSYFSQDLLEQKLAEFGFHVEPTGGIVSDFMSRNVYTAYPDTTIEELARMMYQQHIHRIIILKPNEQKPIGVVTTFDLLKLLADSLSTAEI